jgi:hypothetical protein
MYALALFTGHEPYHSLCAVVEYGSLLATAICKFIRLVLNRQIWNPGPSQAAMLLEQSPPDASFFSSATALLNLIGC